MLLRNESGMKLFLFPNLLSRLHDASTKSTLFERVNQNEWIKLFADCKRYEIVPYSGVYTMPYSNQSSLLLDLVLNLHHTQSWALWYSYLLWLLLFVEYNVLYLGWHSSRLLSLLLAIELLHSSIVLWLLCHIHEECQAMTLIFSSMNQAYHKLWCSYLGWLDVLT